MVRSFEMSGEHVDLTLLDGVPVHIIILASFFLLTVHFISQQY